LRSRAIDTARRARQLERDQCEEPLLQQNRCMGKLIYRCTRTGMNVQVEMPEPAPTDPPDSYESVTCPACSRIHLINKTTGRLLSDNEKK
jgi:hypothetical protein